MASFDADRAYSDTLRRGGTVQDAINASRAVDAGTTTTTPTSTGNAGSNPISNSGYGANYTPSSTGNSTSNVVNFPTGNAPTAPTAPTSSSGSSSSGSTPYTPSQSLPGYSYNVNDPTFLNMSPEQRLQAFKSNPNLALQELNRVKGVYGNTTDPNQQQVIHNWADQVRSAAGIDPNDPFFGNGSSLNSQGQAHVVVNGQKEPDMNITLGNTYDTGNKIADLLGVSYSRNPQTGAAIIGGKEFPVSFTKDGQAYVPARLVAETLGYKVSYDPTTNTATITGNRSNPLPPQPIGQGQPTMTDLGISPYMQQLIQSQPQQTPITPYQAPDLSAWQNQLMGYQQFNPDWNNYYQQAHNQIDPLYQTQYNGLMSKQAADLRSSDESMNRRGIFTSGLAEAAANDLRAKTTDAVASVFNKQMSEIATTAQKLYNDAFSQWQKGNQFALDNNKNVMSNILNMEKQSFTEWLQGQKLDQTQYNYAVNAFDKMAALIQHDVQFNQNMAWNQYKFENLSADQQANLQKSYDQMDQTWQKALLPYQNMTQYQQGQLNQGQQKIDIQQAAQQAANYFKQMGINVDMAKLQEAIRHNQASESLQSQKLTADTLKSQAQLQEKINYDMAMIDKASAAAMTSAKRLELDSYKAQLSSVTQQIGNYVNAGHPEQTPGGLLTQYNDLMSKIGGIINLSSGASDDSNFREPQF